MHIGVCIFFINNFISILQLQDKIRQANSILKFYSNNNSTSDLEISRQKNIRKHLLLNQDELYVLMEALKSASAIERKRKSAEVSWQVRVEANNLKWFMMMFLWLNGL